MVRIEIYAEDADMFSVLRRLAKRQKEKLWKTGRSQGAVELKSCGTLEKIPKSTD